jgi:uncharacterized protein (DUF1697 family)
LYRQVIEGVELNLYVAFLRGINVGGKNILPMNDLVGILESMGCENVKTYIQSGNAVFRTKESKTKRIAEEIGSKILASHGFRPKVLLLGVSELEEAIINNPFRTEDGKALHFFFLESTPLKPDLEILENIKSGSEEFRLNKNLFYLYAPDGIGRSKLAAKVEQALGVPATGRNWNTINILIAMAKQS